jgi:hypothetical protein
LVAVNIVFGIPKLNQVLILDPPGSNQSGSPKLSLTPNQPLSPSITNVSPLRFLRSRDVVLMILQHSCSHGSELGDKLWDKTNPDIEALRRLKAIIGDHSNSSCQTEEPMNRGAYARVFLQTEFS